VKLHRAITLAVLILVSVLVIAGMTADGIRTFNFGSLAALLVVVAAAAIAGIAFSWRRYFPRRR
jgi:hypothetical protein